MVSFGSASLQAAAWGPRPVCSPPTRADSSCLANGAVACSRNADRPRASCHRCHGVWSKRGGAAGHGGGLDFHSIPVRRRIPTFERGPKLGCTGPSDVELEEEAEAVVDNERSGAVAGTGIADKAMVEILSGESSAPIANFVQRTPSRYKLMGATSLAFVICNMDKVNMSVAIIPMAHQLGWSASTSGLVQSSFFWGYAISQLPGGFLAARFSGGKVLEAGVLAWSLATALVPISAPFLPGLLLCRLLVGLGEGVSPAAATDLIARTMPVYERSRAVSLVFGGLNVGSVSGLLLAPVIIRFFGWEVVFYIFGVLGVLWCFGFRTTSAEIQGRKILKQSKQVTKSGNDALEGNGAVGSARSSESSDPHSASFNISDKSIPWAAFFKDPAIWAMMYAHFCGNWGHYNLLSWFPTYFSEELNLNLTNSALVSILPPLGSVLVSVVASSLADHLISRDVDITFVRKLCQTIGFVSPAACMTLISLRPDLSPFLTAGILTLGSSLSTFTLAGLYCSHQDISPKYSGFLLGLTNTAGAIPGIVGVALTGYLLDHTKSWTLSLFAPCIFFYVTGAIIWNAFASSEPKEFQ